MFVPRWSWFYVIFGHFQLKIRCFFYHSCAYTCPVTRALVTSRITLVYSITIYRALLLQCECYVALVFDGKFFSFFFYVVSVAAKQLPDQEINRTLLSFCSHESDSVSFSWPILYNYLLLSVLWWFCSSVWFDLIVLSAKISFLWCSHKPCYNRPATGRNVHWLGFEPAPLCSIRAATPF